MLFSQATHVTTATAAAANTTAKTTIPGTSATTTTTTKATHATTTTKLQAVYQGWQCPNCTLVNDDARPGIVK